MCVSLYECAMSILLSISIPRILVIQPTILQGRHLLLPIILNFCLTSSSICLHRFARSAL